MDEVQLANRLRRLPRTVVQDREVPVAVSRRSRLLGLALLPGEIAGAGLLIPHCRSVHTFGMRFSLDVAFLDGSGAPIRIDRGVRRGRILICRGAAAVLELPAEGTRSSSSDQRL